MSTRTPFPPQPTTLTWLWPHRIPLGKITLLAGDPGVGKSFLALDLAARLSTGSPMPHQLPPNSQFPLPNSALPPSPTLLLSSEDALHDTILPRLNAQHADTELIIPLRCINAQKPEFQNFSLKQNLNLLQLTLEKSAAKLIILDPITAFMQGIDQNSTSQIRQHLSPLVQLAAQHNVAILAITHLNKEHHRQSLYRATGSLALAAIARTVLLVHPHPSKTHQLLTPLKSNLAEPTPSLPFRIKDAHLEWLPTPSPCSHLPTEGAPSQPQDSALSTQDYLTPQEFHDRQFAIDFLLDALRLGPKPAIPLLKESRQLAISERTLKRAKAQLGILSEKIGKTEWHWTLPNQATAT